MEKSLDFLGYFTYSILSTGQVRDLRTGTLKDGHFDNGYRRINLTNTTGSKQYTIHRLVALAFIPNPNALLEIDHINRNKSDNSIENLRWCNDFLQNQNKGTHKNNKLGEKNIVVDAGSYRVVIKHNGKHYRKRCATLDDAKLWRDNQLQSFVD